MGIVAKLVAGLVVLVQVESDLLRARAYVRWLIGLDSGCSFACYCILTVRGSCISFRSC